MDLHGDPPALCVPERVTHRLGCDTVDFIAHQRSEFPGGAFYLYSKLGTVPAGVTGRKFLADSPDRPEQVVRDYGGASILVRFSMCRVRYRRRYPDAGIRIPGHGVSVKTFHVGMYRQALLPHSVVEGRTLTEWPHMPNPDALKEDAMSKLGLLDPTQKGRQAQDLEHKLRGLVVGQEEATEAVVTAYQSHIAGLSPVGRPAGNFLFLGPTGSGKTRIVEATAQALFGDSQAIVKIDCAEYQHGHEIAKLIGSPPGYLGHRETHALLSQEVLNKHHTDKLKLTLVLFDEIEKASDTLWNLLLGILDKGVLTLGDNRRVDFSSAMVFMTSNLGAREMSSLVSPRLGFHVAAPESSGGDRTMDTKRSSVATEAARRKFTPEFVNRLDRMVVFKSLGARDLRRIVDIELAMVQQRIQAAGAAVPFDLSISRSAREMLVREGVDPRYGARPLKRAIERLLVQPLASLIASGQIRRGDCIAVSHQGDSASLVFCREARGIDAWKIARPAAA